MSKNILPVYQIQDFKAQDQKERYFYLSTFASHLQEHLFIREPHKHNFYIILLITQGSGVHIIDFKTYEVKSFTVFCMVPGQVHSWELSEDADGFVVFFTPEFYNKEFPHRKLFNFPFFNALLHIPILAISSTEESDLLATFKTLQKEQVNQGIMRDEMLSSYLNVLLIQLTRMYKANGKATEVQAGELSILQHFENLIEKHYKEHLPVSFYADKLNITVKHLSEICKASVVKTSKELLQKRSILEAQRLLVHSDLNSSQIAAELGYIDTTYFFRFFKKHTGYTPEQFRISYKVNR